MVICVCVYVCVLSVTHMKFCLFIWVFKFYIFCFLSLILIWTELNAATGYFFFSWTLKAHFTMNECVPASSQSHCHQAKAEPQWGSKLKAHGQGLVHKMVQEWAAPFLAPAFLDSNRDTFPVHMQTPVSRLNITEGSRRTLMEAGSAPPSALSASWAAPEGTPVLALPINQSVPQLVQYSGPRGDTLEHGWVETRMH